MLAHLSTEYASLPHVPSQSSSSNLGAPMAESPTDSFHLLVAMLSPTFRRPCCPCWCQPLFTTAASNIFLHLPFHPLPIPSVAPDCDLAAQSSPPLPLFSSSPNTHNPVFRASLWDPLPVPPGDPEPNPALGGCPTPKRTHYSPKTNN